MEQRVVGRYKRSMTSQVAQWVKNPPAMQESWVWSLGREDPLEEGMAIHSSILALRIPWTEEPGRLTVHRISKELDMTEVTKQACSSKRSINRRHSLHLQKSFFISFTIYSYGYVYWQCVSPVQIYSWLKEMQSSWLEWSPLPAT